MTRKYHKWKKTSFELAFGMTAVEAAAMTGYNKDYLYTLRVREGDEKVQQLIGEKLNEVKK